MYSNLAKMKKREKLEGYLGRAEVGKSGHGVVLSGLLLGQGSLNGVITGYPMSGSDHTSLLPHDLRQKPDQISS